MQGLERDADAFRLAVLEQQGAGLSDLGPGRGDILRARRQAAHHHDEALGPKLGRRGNGAAIGLDIRAEAAAIRSRDIGAPAVSRHSESGLADLPRDGGDILAFDLAAPRRDAAEAGPGHGIDHRRDGRLESECRGIDRAGPEVAGEVAHQTP